jgi:hypothetical protein
MDHLRIYRPIVIAVTSLVAFCGSDAGRVDAEASLGSKTGNPSVETRHWREAQSCGVACGYMLARLVGQDVDYKDAIAAIPIESGGTSLLALQKGLRTMGVSTTILKAKPTELDRTAMPVIAHMLPRHETSSSIGHFLLVLQIDDHFVRYVEPNYAASIETVPRNQFLRCWTGYLVVPKSRKSVSERCLEFVLWSVFAITISMGGLSQARWILGRIRTRGQPRHALFFMSVFCASCVVPGCTALRPAINPTFDLSVRRPEPQDMSGLVAWNTEADLGALPRDGAAEAQFRIENQGDAEVRLHLGSPTCRCSQARIERETLKAGEWTNVRMVMRSRPDQAGPMDARVYLEAERGRWAEMLSVHAVELGANFPPYTYVVGGPPRSRSASVVGDLFLKDSKTIAKVDVPLVGTGLESLLVIRDQRVGPPIEMPGCVRRECSFTIVMRSKADRIDQRREVMIPLSVSVDGEKSTNHVRLTILPTDRPRDRAARKFP